MNRIPEWRPKRKGWKAIVRGDRVRFLLGSGPRFETAEGPRHLTLPGVFVVLEIFRRGKRVWLEVRGESTHSGTFLAMVEGRGFRREDLPGVLWRPYRVRRVKGTERRGDRGTRGKAVAR